MRKLTIAQARRELEQELVRLGIDVHEARRESELVLEHLTGMRLAQQILQENQDLTEAQMGKLEAITQARHRRVPLQYVLGKTSFMGLDFAVEPGVLIPRADTETLVLVALERLPDSAESVLDIGTGSGAIAVSMLVRRVEMKAWALDVSPIACRVAQLNAQSLGVDRRFSVDLANMESYMPGCLFDAIVSNPPYINPSGRDALAPEVRDHEPELALFGGGPDGLASYRCIADRTRDWLAPGGFVAVEVGAGQAEAVAAIFEQSGWGGIESHFDLNRIARVVTASI